MSLNQPLNNAIAKIKKGSYTTFKQTNKDVSKYFKDTFGFATLPAEFIEFMAEFDGAQLPQLTIFSISPQDDITNLTYLDYSNTNMVKIFCKNAKIKLKNYLFFATDNQGGRYAFLDNDNQVYYINPNLYLDAIITLPDFTTLLTSKLK